MADVEAGRRRGACAHPGFADATTGAGRAGARPRGSPRPCGRGSRPRASGCQQRRTRRRRRSTGRRRRCRDSAYARRQHGAHRAVGVLHVAQVARILDHDDLRRWRAAAAGRLRDDPLREVAHTRARTHAPRRCRAAGRSPSSPRRTRRCRRRRRRRPASTRSRAAPAGAPRLTRPACRCSAPQQSPPVPGRPTSRAGGAHHPQRGAVHVALPRVHHAAGEASTRRDAGVGRRAACAATRATAAAARTGAGRGAGAAPSHATQVSASSSQWRGSTTT